MSERVPSGISGLDELMGGGFRRGSNILLSGVPGSGKTTFGVEFLYKGATENDEPGLFITLEESIDSIIRNMKNLGMDLKKLISKKMILFIDANPIRGETLITTSGQHVGFTEFKSFGLSEIIRQKARENDAKRIVIDPLTSLLMNIRDEFEKRLEIARLLIGLSNLNCTTLLSTELRVEHNQHVPVEYFISDGVIILDMITVPGGIIRGIQIQKIRGVKHDFDYHLYHITEKGIVVFPKEKVYAPKKGEQ